MSTMISASSSPVSLKPLSLSERNLNIDHDNLTLPITQREIKDKKRASINFGENRSNGVMFDARKSPGKTSVLSPRRAARRSMVCSLPTFHNQFKNGLTDQYVLTATPEIDSQGSLEQHRRYHHHQLNPTICTYSCIRCR